MADDNTPVFQIQRVYLKESSLEQPNSPAILLEQEQPSVDIQLGINANPVADGVFEISVTATVHTKIKDKNLAVAVCAACTVTDPRTASGLALIDGNPLFSFQPIEAVCDPWTLAAQHKLVSVTQAFAVDLTGQVCADSIGSRQYSGVGGQMDFIRGAALSEGGKPIIALPSTSSKGESRIVPLLHAGEVFGIDAAEVQSRAGRVGVGPELVPMSNEPALRELLRRAYAAAAEVPGQSLMPRHLAAAISGRAPKPAFRPVPSLPVPDAWELLREWLELQASPDPEKLRWLAMPDRAAASPHMWSSPLPPESLSLPDSPISSSLPSPPDIWSLPSPP